MALLNLPFFNQVYTLLLILAKSKIALKVKGRVTRIIAVHSMVLNWR